MKSARTLPALGIALALALPAAADGQLIRGSGSSSGISREMRAPTIRREPLQPPVTMGTPRQRTVTTYGDGYYGGYGGYYGGGYSYRPGRPYGACYYGSWCRPYVAYSRPYVYNNNSTYNLSYVHIHTDYYGWPIIYPTAYPAYTTFWAPSPVKIWSPASTDSQPAVQKDQFAVNSADIGRVMRIETVSDSVTRINWLGTPREIREARVFLADSLQQSLRGALVDKDTPSALLKLNEIGSRVAFVGLTVTLANGLVETTLVPYRPSTKQ